MISRVTNTISVVIRAIRSLLLLLSSLAISPSCTINDTFSFILYFLKCSFNELSYIRFARDFIVLFGRNPFADNVVDLFLAPQPFVVVILNLVEILAMFHAAPPYKSMPVMADR